MQYKSIKVYFTLFFKISQDSEDQFQVISEQLYELQDKNAQLQKENSELKSKISNLIQFPPSNISLESINEQQNQLQTDCDVENKNVDLLMQKIQTLQQQISDLKKEQIIEKDRNLRQLQLIKTTSIAIQLQKVAELPLNCGNSLQQEIKINQLQSQIEQLNTQLQSSKQIIQQYQEQKYEDNTKEYIEEIQNLKNKNLELEKQNMEDKATIESLSLQNENLQKQNEELTNHLEELQNNQLTCQPQMQQVTQQLSEYNTNIINLLQQFAEIKGKIQLAEQKVDHAISLQSQEQDISELITQLNETDQIFDHLDDPQSLDQTVQEIVTECQNKINECNQKEIEYQSKLEQKELEIQTLKAQYTKSDSSKNQIIEQLQLSAQQNKDYIDQQNQIFQQEKQQFVSKYNQIVQETEKCIQQYEQENTEGKVQTIQEQLENKVKQITDSLQQVIENAKEQSFNYFNANIAEKIYNLTQYINGQLQQSDNSRFTSDTQKELDKLQSCINQIVNIHKEKLSENAVLSSKILTQQQLIDIDSYNKNFVDKLQTENMDLKQQIKMVKEKSVLFDQQEEIIKTYIAQIQDQDKSLEKLQTLINLLQQKFKQAQEDTIEDLARIHCNLEYKDVQTRNEAIETETIQTSYKEVQTDLQPIEQLAQNDTQQIQTLITQNEINKLQNMSSNNQIGQQRHLTIKGDTSFANIGYTSFDVDRDVQEVHTFDISKAHQNLQNTEKGTIEHPEFEGTWGTQGSHNSLEDYPQQNINLAPKIEKMASMFSQQATSRIQSVNQSQQVLIGKMQSQAVQIKQIKHRSLLDKLN